MLLLPDPTSAVLDPFRTYKTLNLTFFVHDPLTREPYSRDPRNVARKAEEYLRSTGIGDTAFFGPEAEFYIFDSACEFLSESRVKFSTAQKVRRLRPSFAKSETTARKSAFDPDQSVWPGRGST